MENSGWRAQFPLRALSPVLLLLFFLPPLMAANDLIGGQLTCLQGTWELAKDFNSPIYVIIGLTIALVAIAYMAGSAFFKPEWTVWARSESITLVWSVVLVGVILAAFTSSCSLSNLMLGGTTATGPGGAQAGGLYAAPSQNLNLTPAARASQYMGELLNNYGVTVASELVRSSIQDQMGALNYAYWSIPVFDGGGMAFSANKRAWSAHKELLVDIYLPLMVSIMAQKLLMDIAIPGVFSVILPAAIMLRMLFPTRDVGNLLLALSFAAYFILPLTYVFFFDATAAVQKNVFTDASIDQPFGKFAPGYDAITGDAMQKVGFMATQAIIAPNLALVVMVSMTMALYKAFRGMVA